MLETRKDDRYLTIAEVAERLHVCKASIYLWLKKRVSAAAKTWQGQSRAGIGTGRMAQFASERSLR